MHRHQPNRIVIVLRSAKSFLDFIDDCARLSPEKSAVVSNSEICLITTRANQHQVKSDLCGAI